MLKYIFSIIVLSICSLFGFSQNTEMWTKTQKPVDFQKLYLHTDREFFFMGDTLWFAAYLVDGQSHVFSKENCNLYIDIIDNKGEVIQKELFVLQNGVTNGGVVFSMDNIKEGSYVLRAYTDYLKNFGNDTFFTKNIRILSIKSSVDIAAEAQILPDKRQANSSDKVQTKGTIDISFLPEGGFLLEGQSNCVAFKAINEQGKGVDISGKIVDEENKGILNFQSIYKGAGKFYIVPEADKRYRVIVYSYPNLSYRLPAVKKVGAKLKLLNQSVQNVQILIQAKGELQWPLHLAALHRGRALFFMDIDKEKVNKVVRIKPANLGGGINRLVLLDKNMNPVSERLVFKNNVEINSLDVEVGDDAYATREEVQLNILPSENNLGEAALVSVAVVDENYLNAENGTENIASYLLLNSELKGIIEAPASYFIDESLSAQVKLDLLMCINGWTSYQWNNLLPDKVELKHTPQLGFKFKGQAKRAFGNKGLADGEVFFMVKSNLTTQYLDLPLDEKGRFEFRNVIFYDSASVFVQGRNKRGKNTIQFDMQFPDLKLPKVEQSIINAAQFNVDVPVSVYRQRYLNEMKLREFYPEKSNILLEDVEVKGKSYLQKWKSGMVRKGDGPYLLTPENTAGNSNIIQFLATKVPGVYPVNGGESITLSPGLTLVPGSNVPQETEPVFWIDYQFMITVDEVRHYSIDMFETIEIMSPPMSYFYRGVYGVVLLTTKTGRTLNERQSSLMGGALKTIKGFTPVRNFYSPKYAAENKKSKIPDYRNTLYWNPAVLLNGEMELYFNACDNVSRYKVIVEGITETGKVCVGEAKFEVDSYSNSKR